MKKIAIIFFIIFFCDLRCQVVISSCNAPDSIIKKYKKDGDRMTVIRTIKINSTYKDSAKINTVLSKKYLDALIAVYNATILPARDTVINQFNIHRTLEEINNVSFRADSNFIWMINLKNNVFPTGNNIFDNLMSKYYLQKVSIYYALGYGADKWVTLKTDTNYNIPEIAKQFSLVTGVTPYYYQFPPPIYPGGPYLGLPKFISDSVNPNFIELTYSYGWGDCPAGCGNQRYWAFKIYNDCSVEYVGSYGNPLPIVGIKEQRTKESEVKIYPNPTNGKLIIESEGVNKITISNIFGQLVYSINNPKANQEIDLSMWQSGVYFLKAEDKGINRIFKMVKE